MDPRYCSPVNARVPEARRGEFPVLALGSLRVDPPVVLAPMAGVTNAPFRSLCRHFGAGLYVGEMITARALLERNRKTLQLAGFGPEEKPRSLQLYGVDPETLGEAVAMLVGEGQVDHVDLNFGCPVRKVTRRGGGAAIPLKPRLLRKIARATVASAGKIPVSMKFRMGIDADHLTYLEAGRIGEGEGCAAVTLHARTTAELYDGEAHWEAIGRLKATLPRIPVLGNGDILEAHDALRMMRSTGCDGVVVGRGCLGRPWLFRDLADVFAGRPPEDPPSLGQIKAVMSKHAALLADFMGERVGVRSFRKHATWYTKGFPHSARMRSALIRVSTLAELQEVLAGIDDTLRFPPAALRLPRGKSSGTQRVALPEGYLDALEDDTPPAPEALEAVSGG